MKIELRANAKINLFLDILAKLPNGYHSLFMGMQSVSLADTVTVQENGEGIIRLTCSEPALPTDSKNIAYRAAQAFLEEAGLSGRGVDIHIEKNIPFEAGLAGGSADGAGVIVGLDRLFGTDMGTQRLCDIGLNIGSDVPFCIAGGTMLSQHTGGILSHLPPLKSCFVVLAKPATGVSTARAYGDFDSASFIYHPNKVGMLDAAANADFEHHIFCGARAVVAAGELARNSDGNDIALLLEFLLPRMRRRTRRVARLCTGIHRVDHSVNIEVAVVNKVFVSNADSERHGRKHDILMLLVKAEHITA